MPPGHLRRGKRDVVSGHGTHGDRHDIVETEARCRCLDLTRDLFEFFMFVRHKVHLVDGDDDARDAHERTHGEVSEGLWAHTTRCIHEENCHIRIGCCYGHVAGVLLMTGSIGDDHPATTRQVHVPIGDVDRDALLALGLQPIGEQGVVDLTHGDRRATTSGQPRIIQLVLGYGARLREQATDQRRFAIVNRPAGHESDDRRDVDTGGAFEEGGHQK